MRNQDKLVLLAAMAVPLVLVAIGWRVLSSGPGGDRAEQPADSRTQAQTEPRPTAAATTETAGVTVAATPKAVAATSAPASTVEPTPRAEGRTGAITTAPTSRMSGDDDDGDPSAAVSVFYDLVARHEFDAAVQLWSPRMQAAYPPDENIDRRFRQTDAITLQLVDTVTQSDAGATVAVDLIESTSAGPRRYVGRWHLVRSASGWLLDQPELQSAP